MQKIKAFVNLSVRVKVKMNAEDGIDLASIKSHIKDHIARGQYMVDNVDFKTVEVKEDEQER